MPRSAFIFWIAVGILLCASLFYGVNASQQRRRIHHGGGVLANGDIVRLDRVIDGDTVTVVKEGEPPATVRILGIKALESKVAKDPASILGRASILELERAMAGRPVRIMLNSPPKDSRGRYLATLFVNDRDMGLGLVRGGLALVYPVYPFPALSLYLHEQELARAGKKGLWGEPEVKRRAIALMEEWQGQAQ